MTDLAIVASKHDAKFANAVRDGALKAGNREVSVSEVLPGSHASSFVVLIWSAALEASHAIDVQALVGLWSEGRLLVVRRDETPVPLGMRDLASVPPGTSLAEVCASVSGATNDDAVSRSPDLSDPRQRKKNSLGPRVLAAVLFTGIAFGGWYYYTAQERARVDALTSRLEAASKATEELNRAKQAEVDLQKRALEARAAEDAARKSGDATALKLAEEARAKAEADLASQTAFVRKLQSEVTAALDAAKKAKDETSMRAEATKSAMVAKAEAPKSEAVPRPEAPKAAEAPKSEAVAKAEPVPTAAAPAAAPRAMSRSAREAQRDAEAAAKALGRPAEHVAAASPTVTAPSVPAKGGSDAEALYQQALTMEQEGRAAEAIRIYRRAARAGHGKAAMRLGDIFDRGVPGVSRDYAESLQWYQTARDLGEPVESAKARGGITEPRRPEIVTEKSVPKAEPGVSPTVAPIREVPKAVPAAEPVSPGAAEAGWSYGVVALVAILILVFAILLWRRGRRMPLQTEPQPRPIGAAAAQAPANVSTLFVSYSHKDRNRVEPIVSLIEGMGRRVWMDRSDITGQTGWAGQIVRAIRECRAVVLMASPNSYSSDQVVRELYLAMNHKKTIVPIEIEPANLPDELQYILAPFQHHRLSGRETREVLGRALAAV